MFDFNKVVFPLYDDLYQLHEVNGKAKFLLFTLGPFGKGILNCFYGDHDRISFILSSSIIPYEKYNLEYVFTVNSNRYTYEDFCRKIIDYCQSRFDVIYDYSGTW